MSTLARFVDDLSKPSSYIDRKYEGGVDQFIHDLAKSTTLYIGNLSFYTTEEQLYEFFSKVGPIRRLIMGLDRNRKTPCGFCFVEYEDRAAALACKRFLDGMKVDERFIRVDLDPGFKEGRQFGRGRSGGQVRDDFREDYDAGRGGWGGASQERLDRHREAQQRDHYEAIQRIPHGRA